jgi:hypothetical protein
MLFSIAIINIHMQLSYKEAKWQRDKGKKQEERQEARKALGKAIRRQENRNQGGEGS